MLPMSSLFFGNLPIDTTNSSLKGFCANHGYEKGLVSIDIRPSTATSLGSAAGEQRSSARVKYENPQQAEAALKHFRSGKKEFRLRGREVSVLPFMSKPILQLSCLPEGVTTRILKETFGQFGVIVKARVGNDVCGEPQLEGYVIFKRRTQAARMFLLCQQNLFMMGACWPVTVRCYTPPQLRMAACYCAPTTLQADTAFDHMSVAAMAADRSPLAGKKGTGDNGTTLKDAKDMLLHMRPSHFAQPNTQEFDFALKWRQMQIRHAEEERRLREMHSKDCSDLFAQMQQDLAAKLSGQR